MSRKTYYNADDGKYYKDEDFTTEVDDFDSRYMDNVTCPYCLYEFVDSFEKCDYSEDEECPNCGKIFGYEREIKCEYNSFKVTED